MGRTCKAAEYAAALGLQVRLGDCLPPERLARFAVDAVGALDLSAIRARYGAKGGQPCAPALLLGVIFYGYATGAFSARETGRATYESIPFRYLAGDLHPDHDTLAHFRRTFLPGIQGAFVRILLVAQQVGVPDLGVVSQDGTKIPADASKSQAVSPQRLVEPEPRVQAEVTAVLDAGFFSAANIRAREQQGIEPYIAPGREAHQQTLADLLAPTPVPPPEGASPRVQMAAKPRTPEGRAIYRARTRTAGPAIGIVKEALGFRPFSPRGERAAAGE